MTGMYHRSKPFSIEMEVSHTFAQGGLEPDLNLVISASLVVWDDRHVPL
jgi:hypothetical protein